MIWAWVLVLGDPKSPHLWLAIGQIFKGNFSVSPIAIGNKDKWISQLYESCPVS